MMQAGYTTADAVAALAIVGLTLAGLLAGVEVIGQGQRAAAGRVSEAVGIRTSEAELVRLFAGQGPFRSDMPALRGDASAFEFPCTSGVCGASLDANTITVQSRDGQTRHIRVPGATALGFSYVGSLTSGRAWPMAPPPPPEPQWQVLRKLVLVDETSARPVAVADVWVEQAANCEFDSVIKDCREGTR